MPSRRNRGTPRRILPALREREEGPRVTRRARGIIRRILPALRERNLFNVPLPHLARDVLTHLVRMHNPTYVHIMHHIEEVYNHLRENPEDTSLLPSFVPSLPPVPSPSPVLPPPEPLECSVCMDRPHQVTLVPCGHPFCGVCPAHLQPSICPLCREPIQGLEPMDGIDRSEIVPLDCPQSLYSYNNPSPVQPTLPSYSPPPVQPFHPFDSPPPGQPSLFPETESEWEATLAVPYWSLFPIPEPDYRPPIIWSPEDRLGMVTCNLCGAPVVNTPYRTFRHSMNCPRR